jgi:TonB family protein
MTVNGEPVGGATVVVPINFSAYGGVMPMQTTISLAHSLPWEASPTASELAAAFPKGALGKTSFGHVLLECRVNHKGGLEDCSTATETPIGMGFGRAARDLSKAFVVDSATPVLKQIKDLYVEVPFDFRDPSKTATTPQIYEAEWLQGPDPDMGGAIYPPEAVKAGVKTGLGVVACDVTHTGTLSGCVVAREDPTGMGFGDTALAVSKIMRMNPWTKQGFPVDGARVEVPIRFNLDAMATTPKDALPKP